MAMSFKGKVTFDFSFVLSSKDEADMMKHMREVTKRVADGEQVDGLTLAFVKAGLVGGLDEVMRLNLKQGLQKLIKEEVTEAGLSIGNVAVRV